MPSFAPVDEQLTYLKKGSSEIIRESELREKLERSRAPARPLGSKGHSFADAGARGLSQAIPGRKADRHARAAISAGAGLRLSRAQSRCRTRRNRPKI